MASDDAEEEIIIETLIGKHFEQILSPEEVKNPDVLLINNPSLIISTFRNGIIYKMYSINDQKPQ